MTVSRKGCIDRTAKLEIVNDRRRTEVNGLTNDLRNSFIGDFACTEGVNVNTKRLCNTDRIRNLYFTFLSKSCRNNILCAVTSGIASTTVNLCRVLTGERAAAMSAVAAVCINDDLTTCKTAITLRTADYKSAGGVYVDLSVFIDEACRNDGLNNIFDDENVSVPSLRTLVSCFAMSVASA